MGRLGVAAARVAFAPTGIAARRLVRRRRLAEAVGGKVVVITGASSGIGEDTARRVAAAGATVALVARRAGELERARSVIDAAGGIATTHPCDLGDGDSVERTVDDVLDRHGRVDVLVNNAGRSIRRPVDQSYLRLHDYQRTMELNYLGAVRLILAFLPGMRAQGSGHIVNVSTVAAQVKLPRFSAYVASKSALDAFTDCVAAEVRDDGVRFTTVYMPLVRTAMIEPTPMYRRFPQLTSEAAAARLCAALVHRPRRVGTPAGDLAALGDAAVPWVLEAVRRAAYRRFPDHPGRLAAVPTMEG